MRVIRVVAFIAVVYVAQITNVVAEWIQMTDAAAWSARSDMQLVRLPGTDDLILFGGHANSDYFNDVWKSSDAGRNWTQLPNAPWEPRSYHMSNTYENYVYMLGGHNGSVWFKDVWRTKDGTVWEIVAKQAEFPARAASAFVVRRGVFYVMGGSNGLLPPIGKGECMNDVWSSDDAGATWKQILTEAPWPKREGLQKLTVLYGPTDTILLTAGEAGYFGPYYNDVWTSEDGINWSQANSATFSKRSGNLLVKSNNAIFTFGGYGLIRMKNDAYCVPEVGQINGTFDAAWIQLNACPWKGRYDYDMEALSNGTVVLLGGEASRFGTGGPYFNDVWLLRNPHCGDSSIVGSGSGKSVVG